jgi:3,4-dihydroxy 2-butanone 4-phosphate synthase / GTP cyclohydrolase II
MKAKGQGEPFQVRDYGVGAQILVDLGVTDMILLAGSHRSYVGLEGYGLKVVDERALAA